MNRRCIYIIANTVNGKKYVGMSASPHYRVKKHMSALRWNRHNVEMLQEDYNKYGKDAFTYRVLDQFDEKESARMEIFMMQVLRTKDKRFGYNYKDKTGTSARAIKGRWRTPVRSWNLKGRYAIDFDQHYNNA